MPRPCLGPSLALVLAAAACSGDGAPKGALPAAAHDARGGADPIPPAPGGVTVTTHRRGGTPHHANINSIVLDAGGTAALTRDLLGEWRIWPALDGTMPSQRLPIDSAIDAVLAPARGGFIVASIDAADGLELLRLGPDGSTVKRTRLPPDPGADNMVAAGERVVVSLTDQNVLVVDADGKKLGKLEVRGTRVEALVSAGADRALALLRKAGATPSYEARWIELAGGKVAWGPAVALAAPVIAGEASALSPDGRLLAYVGLPPPPAPPPSTPPNPTAPGAGAPALPKPPPPPVNPAQAPVLVLVDLTTAKALPISEPATVQAGTVLGFTAPTDLVAVDQGNGTRIAVDVAAGTTSAFGDNLPVRTGPTGLATGVAVGAHLASLAVARTDGTVRYLGHKDTAPTTGALSPSGKTAAWLSSGGVLIVERLDEEQEHVIAPDAHTTFSLVELIDDATVIVLSNQSVLQMFDIDTGKALGDTPVTAAAAMQYDADTQLLLVPSGNSVWLYAIDRASPTPFGKRMVVPETTASLLDPDVAGGAVLLGSDGSSVRRYTRDELVAGVSRAMAREKRVSLPTSIFIFDHAGRPYNLVFRSDDGRNGRYLETYETATAPDPWNPKSQVLAKVPDDVAAVVPAPDGNRFLAYDSRGTLLMYDAMGKTVWTAASPAAPSRLVWSDAGDRVLVVSTAGGEIFDAATGASLVRACGWRFTADVSPPQGSPMGVQSVCTAAIRR
jgi:hypothetical protein